VRPPQRRTPRHASRPAGSGRWWRSPDAATPHHAPPRPVARCPAPGAVRAV